jgi:hypothetical protein
MSKWMQILLLAGILIGMPLPTLAAENFSGNTVIVRGPYHTGYILDGNINCVQAFNDFVEKSGYNDLYPHRDKVFLNAVGMSGCRSDGTNTYFELYAKFIPADEEGARILAQVMKKHEGQDFYGTPIKYETPSHILVETKFKISRGQQDPVELRKVELMENGHEYQLGDAFSKRAKGEASTLEGFRNLVASEFKDVQPDFVNALKDASFLEMKKSMIYIFEDDVAGRSVDWFWQFWGSNRMCSEGQCPKALPQKSFP